MKAVVTGATGFLGGHVTRLLAERGDEVRVTYRDAERLKHLEAMKLPSALPAEGFGLMSKDWRCSSEKAKRELGYTTRPLDETIRDTVDWYLELIAAGAFHDELRSGMSTIADGLGRAASLGLLHPIRIGQRLAGLRVIAGV